MALIPPPWEKAPDAPASPEVPRAANGRFVPGHTGNPAGRPPGIVDRRHRVAKAFDAEFDAIGAAIVEKAKGGDMAAAALYLSRVEPPLRPKGERVTFQLDPKASLADQASAVLLAVSQGELPAETGKLLIDCITAAANLRAVDELEARLAALEARGSSEGRRAGVVISREGLPE